MPLADFYEIIDEQFAGSSARPMLNVFHVMQRIPTVSAATAAQAYVDHVLPHVVDIQSNQILHRRLIVKNLGDNDDFTEVALGDIPGGIPGTDERAPRFLATAVQFLRERTDMKHGWKRFTGITESHLVGDSLSTSAQTTLQNIGNAIVTPWELASNPGTQMFDFAIIARVCAEVGPLGVCARYRMPENDLELEYYLPSEALAKTRPTSQSSRKLS